MGLRRGKLPEAVYELSDEQVERWREGDETVWAKRKPGLVDRLTMPGVGVIRGPRLLAGLRRKRGLTAKPASTSRRSQVEMRLTAEEEACTRQVAAQIGRNLDDLIREGEQVKASGWRSAQQQAEGWAQRSAVGGGLGMVPGAYQDPCAGPSVMAAHRDHHPGGRQSEWEAEPG